MEAFIFWNTPRTPERNPSRASGSLLRSWRRKGASPPPADMSISAPLGAVLANPLSYLEPPLNSQALRFCAKGAIDMNKTFSVRVKQSDQDVFSEFSVESATANST